MNKELIVITTYFNPCGYTTRRRNYELFINGLKKNGVNCLTIECVFGDQKFELPESLNVVRVRSESVLWQKERLLNIVASWIPNKYKYVAWLDCDIIFDNPNWVQECCKALQRYQVVQVFETCKRLDRTGITEADPIAPSFAYIQSILPQSLDCGRYDVHGHTGYGWAMRKSLFEDIGLYEGAISGSADHFMAHAIYNKYGFCVENALKHDPVQIQHLMDWGNKFYSLVHGSLGYVSGNINHLWHGSTEDRRYFLRMHDITDLGYDPYTDIIAPMGKPLEWTPSLKNQKLKEYFYNYFINRREDGEQLV